MEGSAPESPGQTRLDGVLKDFPCSYPPFTAHLTIWPLTRPPLFADPWITRLTSAKLLLSRKYHFISFMAISSKGDSRLLLFLASWLLFYGDFRSYWYVRATLTHPTQYWISTTNFRFMDKETSFVRFGFSRQRWHIVISHKDIIPPHKSFLSQFFLSYMSNISDGAKNHVKTSVPRIFLYLNWKSLICSIWIRHLQYFYFLSLYHLYNFFYI